MLVLLVSKTSFRSPHPLRGLRSWTWGSAAFSATKSPAGGSEKTFILALMLTLTAAGLVATTNQAAAGGADLGIRPTTRGG